MFGLLLIPALLGLIFIVDDEDDANDTPATERDDEVPTAPEEDLSTGEAITTLLAAGENSFDGTGANDRVEDTDESSVINGGSGNDVIQGRGGLDTLDGGPGNDTIFAGDGDDSATGGSGNDRVFLSDGDDVYSPEFDDTADLGNDFIRGGAGDDLIVDFNGSNTIFGDAGDDVIATFGNNNSADTVGGGVGDDIIFADNADLLTGGDGEDVFAILSPADIETEAVIITDFNPDEDSLIAFVPEADQSTEEIEFEFDEATNTLQALWRGDAVAVLNGLTSADAANIDVTVIDAQDLINLGFG